MIPQVWHYILLQTPEIMRVPLEEIVLQIHHLNLSEKAEDFLTNVLQPPAKKSVTGAIQTLVSVGALTDEEQLTPLGMITHNKFNVLFSD